MSTQTPALLNLPALDINRANTSQQAVLQKALDQVGFIPNMYAHMVHSPGLLDTYLYGYSHFRDNSELTPVEQEVIFLTISRENSCHYCVTAHSMLADKMSGVPKEVTQAIRDNAPIDDPKLAALSTFTQQMVESRGNPTANDIEAFLAAGYSQRHALEIVLAIAVKTLSNFSNHLFNTPVDEMFAPYLWHK